MEGQVIRVRVELESVPSILGFARWRRRLWLQGWISASTGWTM